MLRLATVSGAGGGHHFTLSHVIIAGDGHDPAVANELKWVFHMASRNEGVELFARTARE